VKRKSLFGKVGILAMMVALLAGTTGVVYGMWSQSIDIDVSSHTGTLSWNLILATPVAPIGGGSISDSVNGNEIDIGITNNPANLHTYSAPFSIQNTGSIPIKIQSITVIIVSGNAIEVTTANGTVDGLSKGAQLDPGDIKSGNISISINDTVTGSFTFTATVLPVQWNQYVP